MDGLLDGLALVDGHCHGLVTDTLDAHTLGLWCTEASVPPAPGVSYLDSPLGLALLRWCGPVLDLPAHAAVGEYLARRAELGADETHRRLLRAAGLAALLIDTGLRAPVGDWLDGARLGVAANAPVAEVVRLEHVAERVAASGVSAGDFASAFAAALAGAVRGAVGVKSVAAYRHGLDLDPARPSLRAVAAAATAWMRAGDLRLTDSVLLRHLLWCGVDTGLPIQIHTGFGDRDLVLPRADPALLQPWCAAVEPTGVPVVLLHCYPYHRQAGWLAQVYPHVYLDVGLTLGHVGGRAGAVLAEYFELAPFGKILYSSDAYGLAELYLVGAHQFRTAMARLLKEWIDADLISVAGARRLGRAVGADNARRLYRL